MPAKLLPAQPLVEQTKQDLKNRCAKLIAQGIHPAMAVVLVGNNPASLSYIRNKKKLCEEVGAIFNLIQLDNSVSEKEFLKILNQLNTDPKIHGIIIQLPVSEGLRKLDLPNLVIPSKDIDGFNGVNTQNLYTGTKNLKLLLPCTPKGVVNLLKYYGVELEGKHIVVLGRSLIVGKPLSMLLSNFDATVTLAHSKTKNLSAITKTADIIISAIGKAHFINSSHLDPGKQTVVVDVGMNTLDGKLVGDVNQADIAPIAGAMTPVPGGVGPMTVVSLIENLITATENQLKG